MLVADIMVHQGVLEGDSSMKGIIYKWTCSLTNKSYIGQTTNEKDRERSFLNEKEFYTSENSKIDNARKKYGVSKDIWKKVVLKRLWCKDGNEKNLKHRLSKWEKFYIEYFNTFKDGYNTNQGGDYFYGHKTNDKVKLILSIKSKNFHAKNGGHLKKDVSAKISKSKRAKYKPLKKCASKNIFKIKVNKLDENGKIIETFNSIEEAAALCSINSNSIREVCRGTRRKHAGGFKWTFADGYIPPKKQKGYSFDKKLKRWRARIKIYGKEYLLGYFLNEIAAKEIYDMAKENKSSFNEWYSKLPDIKEIIYKKYGEI